MPWAGFVKPCQYMQLTKEKAKELYDFVPDSFKGELEKEFGKKAFEKREYEKLNTFDDCCRACDTTEEDFKKKFIPLGLSPDALNLEALGIINKAINGPGWKANHADHNQQKHFPIFAASSSGFGFSFSYYDCGNTNTYVGSRLCLESGEKAVYSGTKFIKFWEGLLTNKNVIQW